MSNNRDRIHETLSKLPLAAIEPGSMFTRLRSWGLKGKKKMSLCEGKERVKIFKVSPVVKPIQ